MNLLEPMRNIIKQSEQIKKDTAEKIKELNDQANKKLADLKIAYGKLAEMNTACGVCDGTGKMWEDDGCGYESRMHKTTCTKCDGTGECKIEV